MGCERCCIRTAAALTANGPTELQSPVTRRRSDLCLFQVCMFTLSMLLWQPAVMRDSWLSL